MLDIAWPELLVIGAVALVAIGPKDLPKVMHQLGRWTGKVRSTIHDLQRSMEQLSYEAEIAERLKKQAAEDASKGIKDEPFMSAKTASTASVEPEAEIKPSVPPQP